MPQKHCMHLNTMNVPHQESRCSTHSIASQHSRCITDTGGASQQLVLTNTLVLLLLYVPHQQNAYLTVE